MVINPILQKIKANEEIRKAISKKDILEQEVDKSVKYYFNKKVCIIDESEIEKQKNIEAINKYGPCPIHRLTFKPISSMLLQPTLF